MWLVGVVTQNFHPHTLSHCFPYECPPNQNFIPTPMSSVKHGGGGIMIWRYINSTGVGFLTNVEERLNGDVYIDMLENYMIPSVHLLSEK